MHVYYYYQFVYKLVYYNNQTNKAPKTACCKTPSWTEDRPADLPRELPIEAWGAVGHRLLGAAFRLEQRLTGRRRYAHEASVRLMPMQDPVLTTRQVREQAASVLPKVRVRRLPFWRYELRWQRPLTPLP